MDVDNPNADANSQHRTNRNNMREPDSNLAAAINRAFGGPLESPSIRPSRPSKRAPSPGSLPDAIDLSSARQLCMGGKMYELIDLTNDEVWFHRCIFYPFLTLFQT